MEINQKSLELNKFLITTLIHSKKLENKAINQTNHKMLLDLSNPFLHNIIYLIFLELNKPLTLNVTSQGVQIPNLATLSINKTNLKQFIELFKKYSKLQPSQAFLQVANTYLWFSNYEDGKAIKVKLEKKKTTKKKVGNE